MRLGVEEIVKGNTLISSLTNCMDGRVIYSAQDHGRRRVAIEKDDNFSLGCDSFSGLRESMQRQT